MTYFRKLILFCFVSFSIFPNNLKILKNNINFSIFRFLKFLLVFIVVYIDLYYCVSLILKHI